MKMHKLSEEQREFILNPSKSSTFIGEIGCGKTYAGMLKVLYKISKSPKNYRFSIYLVADSSTRSSFRDDLCLMLDSNNVSYSVNKTENYIHIHYNDCRIFILSHRTKKIPKVHGSWIDEFDTLSKINGTTLLNKVISNSTDNDVFITSVALEEDGCLLDFVNKKKPSITIGYVKDNPSMTSGYIEEIKGNKSSIHLKMYNKLPQST